MKAITGISRQSLVAGVVLLAVFAAGCADRSYVQLKSDFQDLPLDKRLTMPLFWQHGEEDSVLTGHVDRILESGNGSFVIESRPHPDWLGPEWFADCKVILDYAAARGMKGWIFDEKWWPSFVADGRVPLEHRARKLVCTAVGFTGPGTYEAADHQGDDYIRTLAGRVVDGEIHASTLADLSGYIVKGYLNWTVPEGTWKIIKFTWTRQEGARQVDLASQSAVDWFIFNVIQPHYDFIGEENILGFFYDEPQWSGNWGLGMENVSPFWKEMMTSQFFRLKGEDHAKAVYTYWETLTERIGRVGFGTYRNYVNSRGGKLTGHFIEEDAWHNGQAGLTLTYGNGGALNIMELEKYNDMPAMDLIGYYGMMDNRGVKKDWSTYQLPKLIGSIAITNNVPGHLAMCEIFGAAGWELTYDDMKWWGDWCQVHGVNVMDPHSFNPKGTRTNSDTDCPPYFCYTGDEANWPKYKEWCERQNRLGYMLTGNDPDNHSVAPVAMLWTGYSKYAEEPLNADYKNEYPYSMQSALDRVHYDHNLMTYSRFDSTATLLAETRQIGLYQSRYKILIMPPVEIIPHAVLVKVKEFYDMGGTVIGWQRVPTRSARFGETDREIADLSRAIWKSTAPLEGAMPLNTNTRGGKAYFVAATDEDGITTVLRGIMRNSGIQSDFSVVSGEFEHWTHYNHRVREGLDVFMLWNGAAHSTNLVARFQAAGTPEIWNPGSMEITKPVFTKLSPGETEISLSIPANESLLVVFKKDKELKN
jgi:hypothetical protein